MKKPHRIINVLHTPLLLYKVINNIKKQKQFIKENILQELEAVRKSADGSMDEKDFKKITGYYGLAVPAILGEAFCTLRGKVMTPKERLASTCQGVITGLGDDYFDKQHISNEALKELIEKPQQAEGRTDYEKISVHYLETALLNVPDPHWMQDQLIKVFQAQVTLNW